MRAVDPAGHRDPTPSHLEWTTDTVAPLVHVDSPADHTVSDGNGVTVTGTASQGPHDDDQVEVEFLDRNGGPVFRKWFPIVDGHWRADFPSQMPENAYSLGAMQTDDAGNLGIDGGINYVVSRTDPVTRITQAPRSITTFSDAGEISYTVDRSGATFQCSLDGAAFAPCGRNAYPYGRLADGRHSFEVFGTDAAGRVDSTPARVDWRVDTHGPRVTREQPVDGSQTTDSTPVISGAAGDDYGDSPTVNVTVQGLDPARPAQTRTVTRDGDRWSIEWPALADGRYRVTVEQTDDVHGWTRVDTTRGFDVITHPPETTVKDKDGAYYRDGNAACLRVRVAHQRETSSNAGTTPPPGPAA